MSTWKIIKWVVGSVLLLALVGGGAGLMLWPAIKKQLDASAKAGKGELVRLEAVSPGALVRTVSAPGYLEATRFVNISARFSAQIVALPFDEGDMVREGDVVVKLDDRDLLAQLASAEALEKAEEARLAGARASFVNAVAEWERQSALHESNDVSKAAMESADAERKRAEAALRASEAAVAQARAGISRVKEELRYTELRSPITGTVTKLNAKVGEVVITGTMNNPGTVIMEINDLSEMIVKIEVDETDIADVRVGQKCRVHLNAYPDEVFDAVVTKIALQRSRARDQSECFLVEALMDLKGRTLYSGLTASVDVEVETVQDVLLAPSQAVLDRRVDELPREVVKDNPLVDQNKTYARVVYRLEGGEAKATPVRTGPSDLRTTAVLAGVDPGTRVIVGPYKALQALKHGQKVRDEEEEKRLKEEKEDKKALAKKGDEPPAEQAGAQQASQEQQKPAEQSASAPADSSSSSQQQQQQPQQGTANGSPQS